MAKRPTITTITSGYNATAQLNANLVALRNAFDNTLSLDGSTPNAMGADLDMNNNNILNLNELEVAELTIGGNSVAASVAAAAASAAAAAVSADEAAATEAAAAASAAAAAVSADEAAASAATIDVNNLLTKAGNLTGLADTAVARQNLGVEIGVDVQAYDATIFNSSSVINDLADVNTTGAASGDGLVFNGTDWLPGPAGGGGMFKGDNGTVGSRAGDIFRINEQTLNTSTTIDADENASCTGPLAIASGVTLTVTSGGNLSIV